MVATGEESSQFRPVAPRSLGDDEPDSPVRTVRMCCQPRAPYHYHDETETLKLKAEITPGTETVRMDDWETYSGLYPE